MDISFPNRVWDGQSGAREDALVNRPPDNLDWNRIVAELAATQAYLLALQSTVDGLSGGGGGGVTSVGLSLPNIFNIIVSPITSSGSLTATLATQAANKILAGPTSGSAAAPTFRNMVLADIPFTIPNGSLEHSSITINSTSVSLGDSIFVGNGLNGQIQINSDGSLAGLRGNALVNDFNGLTDAVAIGNGSFALGEQSLAVGNNCVASCDYCYAEGNNCVSGYPLQSCTVSGTTITISGVDVSNDFLGSVDTVGDVVLFNLSGGSGPVIAYGTITSSSFDGTDTILTLSESVTSHISGYVSPRDYSGASHAEGDSCVANNGSHAEGNGSSATGVWSHAEGQASATKKLSHAEGWGLASGTWSHAESYVTVASGFASHAEGNSTVASTDNSHAEGSNTTASGISSHAGGNGAVASHRCEWARSDNSTGKIGHLIVSGQTIDTNPISLLIGGTDLLTIDSNKNVTFFIILSATKSDGSVTASFIRYGQIKNVGGTLTLSSIQTIGTDINTNSWSINITADTEDGALQISVTAEATVNWQGRIEFVEVGF